MTDLAAESLGRLVEELDLVDARALRDASNEVRAKGGGGRELVQHLMRQGLLTNYQADKLQKGERTGYFYGNYKILYLVGTGTFARVFRAVDKYSGEVRAVKVLRKRFAEDQTKTAQFFREGDMGKGLRHPNIVPVYEAASDRDANFFVMEFIEGQNLRDFVKVRKQLEPGEATRIARDICEGLAYAITRGLCHRDLKLSNVLITTKGQAKIVDFGLAGAGADMAEGDHEEGNPRTVDYAGLERATGAKKDDPRSDIFFLGCMYYQMLSGHPPLRESKDRQQRMSKARFTDTAPISRVAPNLPDFVAAIVSKSMHLDPERRYRTPQEMLVDLTAAQERLAGASRVLAAGQDAPVASAPEAAATTVRPDAPALMFVESNVKLQDMMREGLKRAGFRVLVTADPRRARERFGDATAIDAPAGIIFSATGLGETALRAFEDFTQTESTRHVPAVLLLAENQAAWRGRVKTSDRHGLVVMPVPFKQFRDELERVLKPSQEAT